MSSRDILKTIALSASSASVNGQTIEVSFCDKLSITIIASVSAATLQATVQLTGTNDDARASDLTSTLPALTSGTAITPLATGITYTQATGVLAFNNPAISTYEVTIAYSPFCKWVRPSYVYTSGGGTVDIRVTLAAWSV